MANRGVKILKKSPFGACEFDKPSPAELSADKSTVNFTISFEEALKLNLA
jgi:hypothetical protein